ncbi:MAG: four helix bundle protein [Candidatus Paceibacterota bacterium]
MKAERFEDLIFWKRSKFLVVEIYRTFRNVKDFGFRDQIQRAAVSVMNNSAEGFERKGNKEFKHFLFIAKGSCGEVRSMLNIAFELGYIDKINFEKLSGISEEISKIMSGFIKKL